jgi:hypothetical protein
MKYNDAPGSALNPFNKVRSRTIAGRATPSVSATSNAQDCAGQHSTEKVRSRGHSNRGAILALVAVGILVNELPVAYRVFSS